MTQSIKIKCKKCNEELVTSDAFRVLEFILAHFEECYQFFTITEMETKT